MSERTPIYTQSWNCGPAIIYPVSVCLHGRSWEDREILVPIDRWNAGERTFGFVNAHGAGLPEYTVTQKVAAGIQHAVDSVGAFEIAAREYYAAAERAEVLRDVMRAIAENFVGSSLIERQVRGGWAV